MRENESLGNEESQALGHRSKIVLDQLRDGEILKEIIDFHIRWTKGDIEGPWGGIDLDNIRMKDEKIEYNDLSGFVRNKLDYIYDDSFIRNAIAAHETILNKKIDRCELINYFNKGDKISKEDLDDDLWDLIVNGEGIIVQDFDDTELRELIDSKSDKIVVGDINDINDNLQQVVKKEIDEPTIVDYINFIFSQLGTIVELDDYGSVMENSEEEIDYGSINKIHTEVIDYGNL